MTPYFCHSFNSRTREGCDWLNKTKRLPAIEFQFTHPGGVRQKATTKRVNENGFQFTHPGGVRRLEQYDAIECAIVSIHAPGRGATLPIVLYLPASRFNSRTREGCDDVVRSAVLRCTTVSIHAPGRGATSKDFRWWRSVLFQFTHPGGVRPGSSARST